MSVKLPRAVAEGLRELLHANKPAAPKLARRPSAADVRIVRCGALVSNSPQPHYDGALRAVESLSAAADAGAEAVVLTELNGAALTVGRDYLAVRAGVESAAPVYWTLTGGGGGAEAGDCGAGCGSLVGLLDDWCLDIEVECKTGEFAGIDATQTEGVYLRSTAARTWTAQSWNSDSAAWEDKAFDYVGGSGVPVYAGETETLSVGNTALRTRCVERDGTFTGGPARGFDGNSTLRAALEPCDPNDFTLRVTCSCCPIGGFTTAGWYGVVDAGDDCEADPCTAVFLDTADGSACDATIKICTERFDTEGEAVAACDTTPPTCAERPMSSLPPTLNYVATGSGVCASCINDATGTMTETIADTQWTSPSDVACGANTNQFQLVCQGGEYFLQTATSWGGCPGGGTTVTYNPAVSGTASPFSLVFRVACCAFIDSTGNESDEAVFVITE